MVPGSGGESIMCDQRPAGNHVVREIWTGSSDLPKLQHSPGSVYRSGDRVVFNTLSRLTQIDRQCAALKLFAHLLTGEVLHARSCLRHHLGGDTGNLRCLAHHPSLEDVADETASASSHRVHADCGQRKETFGEGGRFRLGASIPGTLILTASYRMNPPGAPAGADWHGATRAPQQSALPSAAGRS